MTVVITVRVCARNRDRSVDCVEGVDSASEAEVRGNRAGGVWWVEFGSGICRDSDSMHVGVAIRE